MEDKGSEHWERHDEQMKFMDQGLNEMLADEVCKDCEADSCSDSDCPGDCLGTEILLELDEQIAAEAVALAKQLVGEWIRDSVE